jgi:hypothetical protein
MNEKIDLSKYEGHTEGPWEAPHEIILSGLNHIGPLSNGQEEVNEVDAQLIADAPLLLDAYKDKCEEVKRLNNIISTFDDFMCNNWTPANVHSLWNELLTKEEEEYEGRRI